MARRTHVVASATGAGTFAVRIAMGDHAMIGDEPIAAGGHGLGPSPLQLLSASLAQCAANCPVLRVLEGGSVIAAAASPQTARAGRSAA